VVLYPPNLQPALEYVNGRPYLSTGGPLTVPIFDAPILEANGWTLYSPTYTAGGSGGSSSSSSNSYLAKPCIISAIGDSTIARADIYGSFTNGNLTTPSQIAPLNRYRYAENFVNWVQVLSNQALQAPDGYIYGASGMGSDVILAVGVPYILSLNPLPTICFVSVGTNDQFYSAANPNQPAASAVPLTAAQTQANLLSIYAQLTAAGIVVIGIPLYPRSDVVLTAAQAGTMLQINEWMKKQVGILSNFFLADANAYLCNPASTNYGAITSAFSGTGVATTTATGLTIAGYTAANSANASQVYAYPGGSGNASSPYTPSTYVPMRPDGLHTSALGGYLMAKSALAVVRNILPSIVQDFSTSALSFTNGQGDTYSNLFTNSTFTSTAASAAAGIYGTIPTGWTAANTDSTTALIWATIVPSANYPLLSLQCFQIGGGTAPLTAAPTVAGTYNMASVGAISGPAGLTAGNSGSNANVIRFYQTVSGTAITSNAGSYIEATVYVEWPGNNIGTNTIPWQGISGVGLQIKSATADSTSLYMSTSMMANYGPYPQEPWSGTIRVTRKILSTANGDPITDVDFRVTIFIYMDGRNITLTGTNAAEPVFANIRFGLPKLRIIHP
jgi:lysophospholipase L1-like esterase